MEATKNEAVTFITTAQEKKRLKIEAIKRGITLKALIQGALAKELSTKN